MVMEFQIYIFYVHISWILDLIMLSLSKIRINNGHDNRADSRLAPSQWETSLQGNTVSHWLGTNLESALW